MNDLKSSQGITIAGSLGESFTNTQVGGVSRRMDTGRNVRRRQERYYSLKSR